MFFRRINPNTINLIISAQDMQEQGIKLDDLFERKKAAMEKLHSFVLEAARRENFVLEDDYNMLRVSVMADHSISLTLSKGPIPVRKEQNTEKEGCDGHCRKDASADIQPQRSAENGAVDNSTIIPFGREFAVAFDCISDVIRDCHYVHVPDDIKFDSSLYQDVHSGDYLLLMKFQENADGRLVFAFNEFGTVLNMDPSRICTVREHEKCIIAHHALEKLAGLNDE